MSGIFSDFTLRTVAMGAAFLGITSGALGSFAVLRRQSLLGDSISHASLPGIVLAFILIGTKSSLVLLIGAAIAGWIATLFILSIIRNTRISSDGAQGVVLSVFFGLGLMLLTFVQSKPNASQAGLDKYLFGQAAALLPEDVRTAAIIGVITIICMIFFWKEFKLMSFDPVYGESLGFSARLTDIMITALIVISIVTGLQTVGVILMSSMLIAPAASARQWTNKLGAMVTLSAIFGAISGVLGATLSSLISNLPTGPTIILCLTSIFIISLLFAPDRGLISKLVKRYRNRFLFSLQKLLLDLYYLEEKHKGTSHAHDMKTISLIRNRQGNIHIALKTLQSRGWAEQTTAGLWKLTAEGHTEAIKIQNGGRNDS
ncbi:MAG: metal ABC transporter permease [Spirochaetales bacterium]|nr:metal ABC transporter permease [Spirochaetales bacterium]